jgi:hypothetical protein
MKTPLDTRGSRANDGRSARLGKKQPDGTHAHRIAHAGRGPPGADVARFRGRRRVVYSGHTMTLVTGERTVLQQSRAGVQAFPGCLALLLVAVVVRQLFVHPPSVAVFIGCGVLAVLDLAFARALWTGASATLVVTPGDITYTARQGCGVRPSGPQILKRTGDSTLSFRVQQAGFTGSQVRYRLLLHDDATNEEITVRPFGRGKVRRACESQGWRFSAR